LPKFPSLLLVITFSCPLGKTLASAHLKVTANLWSLLVNRARKGLSIQGRAPTVIQPGHAPHTPLIKLNKIVGHTGIGNKHDFQTTAAGLAIQTAHLVIRQAYKFNCHAWISFSLRAVETHELSASVIACGNHGVKRGVCWAFCKTD
jgi:hypothetical protein